MLKAMFKPWPSVLYLTKYFKAFYPFFIYFFVISFWAVFIYSIFYNILCCTPELQWFSGDMILGKELSGKFQIEGFPLDLIENMLWKVD